MARHHSLLFATALLATTACTQDGVEVVDKSGLFFGQQQTVAVTGSVPAQQPKEIAAKYQEEEYVSPAPLMEVTELETVEPPQAVEVETLAPLAVSEPVATPVRQTHSLANSTFKWPLQGPILSHFGPKSGGLVNDGINISASEGEPIWSAAAGEVVYAGSSVADYGNMVILRHSNGWMSAYGHASDLLVKKGDSLKQGDLIGYVGQSGNVTEPQLHFGIRKGEKPVDPLGLLPQSVASIQ